MSNIVVKKKQGLISAFVVAAALLLAALLGLAMGCVPHQGGGGGEDEGAGSSTEKTGPLASQLVDWNMGIECGTCHTFEQDTMTDAAYHQAYEHSDLDCIQCHTEEAVLKAAHEGVTYADVPATKATVTSVESETCQVPACHGTLADMAAITADNQDFKDAKGTVQNPHEYASNPDHDANTPTCTDCHKIHSQDILEDAMKWCAQCHHRGEFTCGNCHELRKRSL